MEKLNRPEHTSNRDKRLKIKDNYSHYDHSLHQDVVSYNHLVGDLVIKIWD